MCNGEFLNKDLEEAWDYFDQLAKNAQSWDNTDQFERSDKTKPNGMTKAGMYHLREKVDVNAKIVNLTRKVEAMELRKVNSIKANEKVKDIYGICETNGHQTQDYPTILAFQEVLHEHANSMNAYKRPFSSLYLET